MKFDTIIDNCCDNIAEFTLEVNTQMAKNVAADCSINQLINRDHLPKISQEIINEMDPAVVKEKNIKVGDTSAIFPDNFPVQPCKEKETAEFYYNLLMEHKPEQDENQECQQCGGSGITENPDYDDSKSEEENEKAGNSKECTCDRCNGTGSEPGQGGYGEGHGKLVDDHGTWNKSTGDKELQKDMTKKMIEHSMNETTKSRGNVPSEISDYLNLFTRKVQVNWRQVLKRIQGNKKINSRRTIMRRDRRLPHRDDLRGKTKDRTFTTVVGVDVSGSMSTAEIMTGLNEISEICRMTNSKMKLIQIDTQISGVTDFDKNTKLFERTGCGGTYMGDCPKYIIENKVECDVLVMISDMYIEDVKTDENWSKFRKKVIWLDTDDSKPDWDGYKNHKIYPLNIGK